MEAKHPTASWEDEVGKENLTPYWYLENKKILHLNDILCHINHKPWQNNVCIEEHHQPNLTNFIIQKGNMFEIAPSVI